MDIVVRREKFLHHTQYTEVDTGPPLLKNEEKYRVALRPFNHYFVDDDERKYFLGENSPADIDHVEYMFATEPPNTYDLMHTKLPPNVDVDTVFMYVLYYDTEQKVVGFVCAPVNNNIEYGSKHMTIINYINDTRAEDMNHLIFVQAGELVKRDQFWEFNHFSGTFTASRIGCLEICISDGITQEEYEERAKKYNAMCNDPIMLPPDGLRDAEKMLNVTNDWKFTKDLLVEINPFVTFEFSSRAFPSGDRNPMRDMLDLLGDQRFYPYVVPGNTPHSTAFEKALAIVGTFRYLDTSNKKILHVNAWVVDVVSDVAPSIAPIVVTALNAKDVDNYTAPIPHMVNGVFYGNVTVLPLKSDLSKALSVLRKINAKKLDYGKNLRLDVTTEYIDIFNLAGKTFNLTEQGLNGKTISIHVTKFLASSNDEVYMCKMDGDIDVVLKVRSLYPFSKITLHRISPNEEAFYGTRIYSFAIPGISALGIIYPYLGRTISDIPLNERIPMYTRFKHQYLSKFISMTNPKIFKTEYNDYKPENTTIDNDGNFQLIDYDERAYTKRFYGPTVEKTFENQLFGVLMVIYWFKTDDHPFNHIDGEDKIKWVQNELKEQDIKDMFDVLLDDEMTTNQKKEWFEKTFNL